MCVAKKLAQVYGQAAGETEWQAQHRQELQQRARQIEFTLPSEAIGKAATQSSAPLLLSQFLAGHKSKIEQDEIKSENRSLWRVELEVLLLMVVVCMISDACVSTK